MFKYFLNALTTINLLLIHNYSLAVISNQCTELFEPYSLLDNENTGEIPAFKESEFRERDFSKPLVEILLHANMKFPQMTDIILLTGLHHYLKNPNSFRNVFKWYTQEDLDLYAIRMNNVHSAFGVPHHTVEFAKDGDKIVTRRAVERVLGREILGGLLGALQTVRRFSNIASAELPIPILKSGKSDLEIFQALTAQPIVNGMDHFFNISNSKFDIAKTKIGIFTERLGKFLESDELRSLSTRYKAFIRESYRNQDTNSEKIYSNDSLSREDTLREIKKILLKYLSNGEEILNSSELDSFLKELKLSCPYL